MSHADFKVEIDEEDEDDSSTLALNKTSCNYAQRFYNKSPKENVAFIPERKQLIKRRILKLQNKDTSFKDADFWWEPKENRSLLEFILQENLKPGYNNYIPQRAIEELNKQIKVLTTKNKELNNFFLVPYFAANCRRKFPITVLKALTPVASLYHNWGNDCFERKLIRIDPPPTFEISPNINMCINPFYTEYMISLICSNLYTEGDSIHFVPVERNSFSTCLTVEKKQKRRQKRSSNNPPVISIQEFFIMDRIEGYPIKDKPLRESVPYKDVDVCLIQVLHSIAVYQQKQISHNDLHGENILIEQILLNTKWDNQELINYAYFQYELENKESLYTPFVPFLIKIIDFGLSCKYSAPCVYNSKIIECKTCTWVDLHNQISIGLGKKSNGVIDILGQRVIYFDDSTGKIVRYESIPEEYKDQVEEKRQEFIACRGKHAAVIPPNWYFPAYDVLMFLINFCVVLYPTNLLGQQILWVALHFPEIPEMGPWNPEMIKGFREDIFKKTTNPKEFYKKYNEKWTDCITGFNPAHKENQIQVVLEHNLIERYSSLNSLSLLKKCMNNKFILNFFTKKPSEGESCIVVGKLTEIVL